MIEKKNSEVKKIDINFENHNRFKFKENIIRVTAGHGGESLLIIGSEKTALYDCGMAYCGRETVKNIEKSLKGKNLDYVLISHTHYDHIGGLPYIKERWPNALVFGAEHGQKTLKRAGALKAIKEMGITAEATYGKGNSNNIIVDNMNIDKILKNGNEISLGKEKIIAIESKGHTDCSMSYFIEPWSLMIASESTGILEGPEEMQVAIIKSFADSMEALEKCRSYNSKAIISPHYGLVPEGYIENYWNLYEKKAKEENDFISDLKKQNLEESEMIELYKKKYWKKERGREQPIEAFILNTKCRFNA